MPRRAALIAVAAALLGVVLVAPRAHTPRTTGPDDQPRAQQVAAPARVVPGPRLEPVPTPAERALARLTLPQRVGQLFMVGTEATRADPAALRQVSGLHVGNVMVRGRSREGVAATARVTAAFQDRATRRATGGVPMLVATDQEGGLVQVLAGPGFSEIPSALEQGRWQPRRLRTSARSWARQLHRAGVNLNLAPVLDTVPSPRAAERNPPIGAYDRQYGYRVERVSRSGRAFVRGMLAGRVLPAVKHFPGLGRVSANTDTTAGVVDRVTRRHDPYLRPFSDAVRSGAPVVMMSSAVYARIDPRRPAAFSPYAVKRVLRGDLGFEGVVISDDLAWARQVARWSPAQRAVLFVAAGGDLVLTVDPAPLPEMHRAVLARARRDRDFRARVDASALRVLEAKQSLGLLRAG